MREGKSAMLMNGKKSEKLIMLLSSFKSPCPAKRTLSSPSYIALIDAKEDPDYDLFANSMLDNNGIDAVVVLARKNESGYTSDLLKIYFTWFELEICKPSLNC